MKKFCDLLWVIRTVKEFENKYQCQITQSYLFRLLESSFLGGRKTKASKPVLELLLFLKLLGIDDKHQLFIKPRGHRLCDSGSEGCYDLNIKQKKLMASWYVSLEDATNKQWMNYFCFNDSGKRQAMRSTISKSLQQWTEEMIYLGVAVQSDDQLELLGEHAWVRDHQPPITKEELHAILELQARKGREAEEYVLCYEKRRLQEQGLIAEADRVECISDSFVNAGYDILSFSTSGLEPNRFIEVKSVNPDGPFYLSDHELKIAKVLGSLYYLYLVDQTNQIEPIKIIKNPYSFLSYHANLEPIQYKVSFEGGSNKNR